MTRAEAEAEMKAAVQQALEMARQRFEAEMHAAREEAAAAADIKFKAELRKARKQARNSYDTIACRHLLHVVAFSSRVVDGMQTTAF